MIGDDACGVSRSLLAAVPQRPIRLVLATSSGQSEAFLPVLANQKRFRQFWPIRNVPASSSGQSEASPPPVLANQKRSRFHFWPIRSVPTTSSGQSETFPPALANQKR